MQPMPPIAPSGVPQDAAPRAAPAGRSRRRPGRLAFVLCAIACLPFAAALGADFDGSKPLICAVQEARDCVSGEECVAGRPREFGLPNFMRVNVGQKTIAGPERTTRVQFVEKTDTQILLLGTELGYAWTLALKVEDGSMAGAIVNHDGVFAFFGACTPQ